MIRNFSKGRMNKSLDERLVPNGEYVDALNVRLGSTEDSEVGSIENAKGNEKLTNIQYAGQALSNSARCIGAFEDGANERIYWFIHDEAFALGTPGILDMVVSYNTRTGVLTYHVVSMDDSSGTASTLNFSNDYLIHSVNLIENILLWTDNYNPPRKIDVKRTYAKPNGSYVDQFTAEELLVIRKPPSSSPSIVASNNGSDQNFLKNRFLCFGYRYRYSNNEYSAISQFSEPAFIPGDFNFDINSYQNTGMENRANQVDITYNTGSSLVKGVELVYKEMDDNVIKVIEYRDKEKLGLVDNTDYTYTFDNSKIYTVLPATEVNRLYDNVPLKAQAQTIMGNRLMYGNYVDGYDLVDLNGNKTKFEYVAQLISEDIASGSTLGLFSDGSYTVESAQTITDSIVTFNLASAPLSKGSTLNFDITFEHDSFSGDTPFPTQITASTTVLFSYTLPQTFDTVYDLVTSTDFVDKIGTASNIQTAEDSCNGTTFTDEFNCAIPSTLSSLDKYRGGITGVTQPISIISTFGSTNVSFQIPAVSFVDNVSSPTQTTYEYFSITDAAVSYVSISENASLHSNRDYEVGIVYMDDFNRSTTALVSEENTVHVPCSASDKQNKIRVTIPTEQVAPSFATRYKFVIKESVTGYETIYSNIFYASPYDNSYYFLLEGENARKVQEGDRLVVKADTNGAIDGCVFATVLEKEEKEENFLSGAQTAVAEIGGVYMKIKPQGFTVEVEDNFFIDLDTQNANTKTTEKNFGDFPVQAYTVNEQDPANPNLWNDITIPVGSRIRIDMRVGREGGTRRCEQKIWNIDETFIASKEYAGFKEWFDGDNIADALSTLATVLTPEDSCPISVSYNSTTLTPPSAKTLTGDNCTVNLQFYRSNAVSTDDGRLELLISGPAACGEQGGIGDNWKSWSIIDTHISITKANDTIVFETEPQDAPADIWYESSDSYSIDLSGNHSGNVQNQDISGGVNAIIDTDFFNCFAFGNGVESYKVRDSIVGKPILLGNRVTSTAGQDYRQVHRFSDITYSGVYNDESNVNKLNEFNIGLANFFTAEPLYGPIRKLFSRQTDILCLQEDKVSYVLAGKNLLSDSAAGGQVASIPEVLGTQIARMEDYGISNNPESFCSWGYNKFFTDVKRGAVIQLRGSSYQNEELIPISEAGMDTWFRDLFIESGNTQKLGGYDPYMDEYVLSSNEDLLPSVTQCEECGSSNTFTVTAGTNATYCVDAGELVGDVVIAYNVVSVTDTITLQATYDSGTVTTGAVSTSGTLTVSKDNVNESQIDLTLSSSSGTAVVEIFVPCPAAEDITIVQVCVTDNAEAGTTVHNEYRWTDGAFVSPLKSSQVTFASSTDIPVRTQYATFSGPQGAGYVPADGATVRVISNTRAGDSFTFNNSVDKLRYLRTNTLYENTNADIASLIAASTQISSASIVSNGLINYGEFTMSSTGDYLYIIYDYRNAQALQLCYSETSSSSACCDCGDCDCVTYEVYNKGSESAIVAYTDCNTSSGATFTLQSGARKYICSETEPTLDSTSTLGASIVTRYRDCGCNSSYFENTFETGPNAAEIRIGTEVDGVSFTGATISSSDSPFAISSYTVPTGKTWNGSYYTPAATVTLSGTSGASSVSFTISGTQNHTSTSQDVSPFTTNLKLTDGNNIYTGVVSVDTTNNVVVTFNIGTAKNRTFRWVANSNLTIFFD